MAVISGYFRPFMPKPTVLLVVANQHWHLGRPIAPPGSFLLLQFAFGLFDLFSFFYSLFSPFLFPQRSLHSSHESIPSNASSLDRIKMTASNSPGQTGFCLANACPAAYQQTSKSLHPPRYPLVKCLPIASLVISQPNRNVWHRSLWRRHGRCRLGLPRPPAR